MGVSAPSRPKRWPQPTAASHDRVIVCDDGHIAIATGIADGADVVSLPEIPSRVEVAANILGHLQRGGRSTAGDRLVASACDVYGADLVAAGRFDRMVAWQNRGVVDIPLAVAIATPHCVDPGGALAQTARGLGICLGDG